MTESRFNKIFSAFILIGMTVALVLTTSIKLSGAESGKWLLLLAAFGSLMGVLSTICSANAMIITFFFGFLDVLLYGVMCFINWRNGGSGLGNALLHFLYFVPMQFIGFAQWRKRGGKSGGEVKARRLGAGHWGLLALLFIVMSVVFYFVIARFDKSSAESFIKVAVVLDVLPLVCNIFGQYLMSTAYMDQWIFWIAVNVFSILMWSRTLSTGGGSYALIYIVKYSFYLLNSFNGLRIWLRLSKNGSSCK